jgi:gliding motility-associated-like protein
MKKLNTYLLLIIVLIATSTKSLKASHGLPLVGFSYTIGATGVTISGSSDPATCGSGPFWMQTKVTCSPSLFPNTPLDACLKSYLQFWTGAGTSFNSFPWFNSLLNVPGYTAALGWSDGCVLEPYTSTFIPFTDLCPGKVYYFSSREIVGGSGGASYFGPFGPVNSFTVPGVSTPCTPGFITSSPPTSPGAPSCGGSILLTFTPPTGCQEKKTLIPGCSVCDTIVWWGPLGVIAVNTPTIIVNPLSTTTYTVGWDTCSPIRKVQCSCGLLNPVITVYVANTNALFSSPPTLCSGSTANLISLASGVDTWSVNPTTGVSPPTSGLSTFNPVFSTPGSYTITHMASNGPCNSISSNVITITPGISSSITTAGGGCGLPSGTGSATVAVSTSTVGLTYAWSSAVSSSSVASGLVFGTVYTVTLSNGGCTITNTLQVNNNPSPVVSSFSVSPVLCFGQSTGSIVANITSGNPPFICAWSPIITTTSNIVNGCAAGTYSLTVTDLNGCTTNSVVTVTQPAILSLSLGSNTTTLCNGNSATLTNTLTGGTPIYTYTWNPGGLSGPGPKIVTPATTTEYTVIGQDANGCIISNTITINVLAPLSISGSSQTLCLGSNANLICTGTISPSLTYTWLPVAGSTSSITVPNTVVGVQSYTAIVSDGCSVPTTTVVFTVSTSPNPIANISADSLVGLAPLTVNFSDAGSGGTSFNWNFANGSTSINHNPGPQIFNFGGIYLVTYSVTNSFGCSAYDSLYIKAIDAEAIIIIPNVFTPNGDKSNDFFMIKGANIVNYECLIYNRWGKLVFSSTDLKLSWDGKINGSLADEGTYFYVIKCSGAAGNEIKKQGSVTLFR